MTPQALAIPGFIRPRLPASAAAGVLRLLVSAALTVDAVVHLQLASLYDLAAPAGIGQGNLFRIESAVALLAAALVLLVGSRLTYAFALLTLAAGLAALLVYRFVNVPAFGPIPAMYEPLWFFKKSLTAVAQAVGVGLSGLALAHLHHNRATRQFRPSE